MKEIQDVKNKIPLKIVGINHGIKSSVSKINNSFNLITFPSFIATETILNLENLVIKNENLAKKYENQQLFKEINSYIPNENQQTSALIPFTIKLKSAKAQPENLKLITGNIAKKLIKF